MSRIDERQRIRRERDAWLLEQMRRFDALENEQEEEDDDEAEPLWGVSSLFTALAGALPVAAVWALTAGEVSMAIAAALEMLICLAAAVAAREMEDD